MELLESARRLGEFPTRFVLWRALHTRDEGVLNLYIDALEDYVAVLGEVCETINALVRALHRAQRSLEQQRETWQSIARRFHEEGKADLARMAEHRVRAMRHQAATYERLLAAQERELTAYQEVRLWLEATLAEARQRREEIEAWLEKHHDATFVPDFARPLPEWDEERLARELAHILGIATMPEA